MAGTRVQKVISFAWDSDYLCATNNYLIPLHDEIMLDLGRPILGQCFFTGTSVDDVVVSVIGFDLENEETFTVGYNDANIGPVQVQGVPIGSLDVNYGFEHNLVGSVQMVELVRLTQMATMAPKGTVRVVGVKSQFPCYFDYDLSSEK